MWEAASLSAAVGVAVLGPVALAQWLARRRQRAAHAAGTQVWVGHLAMPEAVGFWDIGVGAGLLFGAGVPVLITARPLGLALAVRGVAGGSRHVPVLVQWSDVTAAHAGPARRTIAWGRLTLLPLVTVTLRLVELDGRAGTLTFATFDAAGLVELVEARTGAGRMIG